MNVKKHLSSALSTLALLAPQADSLAADVFWHPLVDGQVLSFLESGRIQDSDGRNETWGPLRLDIRIEAVDVQVLDHRADWRLVDNDSRFSGTYLDETAAGLMRVSEGHPATDVQYRYYTDAQPWIYLTQPLNVGDSLSFAGQRRGQWPVPGGGTETWSGGWTLTLTHMGSESVTTPLGSFDALMLWRRSTSTIDSRSSLPNVTEDAFWDETLWFVPGTGMVKMQGSGRIDQDFNGDGLVDRWQFEELSMVAVPEPASPVLWLVGLATLALALRAGRRAADRRKPNAPVQRPRPA